MSSVRIRSPALRNMEFSNWFEGKFNNWKQAASNPTGFAHIILEHTKIEENVFNVIQYRPGQKPYRNVVVTIEYDEDLIVVQNEICKYYFKKIGSVYRGSVIPGTKHKGALLVSKAELSETQYKVVDMGIDSKTNKLLWGSGNGTPFIFEKI